jgi:hypothetical protein
MKINKSILIFTILLATAFIQNTKAQTTQTGQPFILATPLTITTPTNTTYKTSPTTIAINFKTIGINPKNTTITYTINGKNTTTIPTKKIFHPIEATRTYPNGTQEQVLSIYSQYLVTGQTSLPNLPKGSHKIEVHSEFQSNSHNTVYDKKTIYFTINDFKAPVISNLSIKNTTYTQNNLLLDFALDQPTKKMYYSLNGEENCTIKGKTTLTLELGSYSLKVYAIDFAGNIGSSEIVNFSIVESSSRSITLISIVILSIVVIGIFVYFKKYRK